jgi:glycosyltransferase involved in cell wall biosynthesis
MAITPYLPDARTPVRWGNFSAAAAVESVRATPPEGRHKRPTVTVIIPTLNEERNIAWVIERIPSSVDEILIVDGHSVDRTVAVARAARPDVVVLLQEGRGKGAALRTGLSAARGDYVVVLDADGSMDPAEIHYYVAALDEGYEFAKGSRYLRRGGSLDLTPLRSLGNRMLVRAVNVLWRVSLTDLCYGYFALRRDRYPSLNARSTGFEIECELVVNALRQRLMVAEVPSIELCRQHGISNLKTWRDGWRVLATLLSRRLSPRPRPVVAVLEDEVSFAFRYQPAVAETPLRASVSA